MTPPGDDCDPFNGDICLPGDDKYSSFSLSFNEPTAASGSSTDVSTRLETVYGYDKYGNKTSVSVTGYSTNTGTSQTRVSKTVYDSRGRFVDYVANALNEKVTYKYNDLSASSASGKQTSITQIDANGLVTKTKYDALGRAYYVDHPDSKVTTTTQSLCINCKTGSYYKITTQMSGAPNKEVYFDRWGREVANSVEGFDGAWNTVVLTYDEQGRQKTVSEPNSSLVTSIDYDVLGRPYLVTSPNGNDVEKRWYGNETQEINGLGQIAYSYQNAFGELVKTVDELGNTVEFEYDSYGNLLSSTTVADGKSSVISNTYDDWGRKLSTNDPIKGLWQYTYNAFGELYTQKTARQHLFTFSYDVLGRKVRSYEASEGTLCWNYGSTAHASSKAVGKLVSTAKYAATSVACNTTSSASTKKTFTYNQLSLPEQTKTYINGQWYTQTQSYDSYSRPKVTTYPSGTSSFAVESVYKSNGYLYLLRNNQTKAKLKQIDDMDERNHVSRLSYGNNVISTIDYESDTGRFSSVQITHSSNPNIHYAGVTYDLIGNVKTRTSNYSSKVGSGSNFTESYAYDDLNRLERRTISYQDTLGTLPGSFKSTQTYTLDGWGNFKYKSGAGYYKYDAAKVHKLLGVYSDSSFTHALYSFSYDGNGNITSDGSRSFTYGSYDKATKITKGSNSSTMYYGVDRELYFKTDSRVEQGKSTTYQTTYLGNYEKVVRSGGAGALTEHKYYVGGDIVVTHRSNGSQSSYYLHKDHQGSVVAVTDQNGKVVSQAIYDPYGKRHSIYVDSLMANFTVPEPTERGYTGHKELKGLGIIHMGGRIYDPTLGRFMQADPFIQAPKNSQNYNRYSYVLNNPMSYTDPSGYFFEKIFREFGRFFKQYGRMVVAIGMMFIPGVGQLAASSIWSAAALGAASGYIATGTMRGALIGAFSGAAFQQIGAYYRGQSVQNIDDVVWGGESLGNYVDFGGNLLTKGQVAGQIAAHAISGGVINVLSGGNFGNGFISAGFTKGLGTPLISSTSDNLVGEAVAHMVIGGTASVLSGGKFSNGARTAWFQLLFNGWGGKICKSCG
ncbi:RHS repeat domain-containing protein [Shewanella colwelliana]|uniref:RHS repeat domain-containing protein n=1 Tax=Shewanella colwelliana TaxID=23 RepID=UPI00048FFC9F|nr:RHS repeat-associated core domain-containing protein [Shewanella colwelliana]